MFAGCRWHWPHNHHWAHRGRGLIFKAFRSNDSLCIHEIDHSGLSVAKCASSIAPLDLGGSRPQGLIPCRSSGGELEGRCDGNRASSERCLWAPSWLKLREAQRVMARKKKSCTCHPNSPFIGLPQNSKYLKIERGQCWGWTDKSFDGIKQNKAEERRGKRLNGDRRTSGI